MTPLLPCCTSCIIMMSSSSSFTSIFFTGHYGVFHLLLKCFPIMSLLAHGTTQMPCISTGCNDPVCECVPALPAADELLLLNVLGGRQWVSLVSLVVACHLKSLLLSDLMSLLVPAMLSLWKVFLHNVTVLNLAASSSYYAFHLSSFWTGYKKDHDQGHCLVNCTMCACLITHSNEQSTSRSVLCCY
jgi:hypothetical protein